jgi:hypothetical protein
VGLSFSYQWPNSWVLSAAFGVPIIVLSTTATLFISLAEKEFQ